MPRPMMFGCAKDDRIYQEQVLPRLLDRTKVTTIRPMWTERMQYYDENTGKKLDKPIPYSMLKAIHYKPGDVCKVLWKPRVRGNIFCKVCGMSLYIDMRGEDALHAGCYFCEQHGRVGESGFLRKQLGKVVIRKVIPVHIQVLNDSYAHTTHLKEALKGKNNIDGFNTIDDLFRWLESHYDLSEPRPFEIRQFDWL